MRLLLILAVLAMTGCVTPDSIKLEADANPLQSWEVDEVTLGGTWKIK